MEKIYLNDESVVNELITNIPAATTEKNGLKPANEVRMERRMQTAVSRVVYELNRDDVICSTSLLISLSTFGGGPMTLFYMSINRNLGVYAAPTITLSRIGGASTPTSPRFKLWTNNDTGAFKIILERIQSTPAIYVKILNSLWVSSDSIPLSVANQDEVDAATYIGVTAV